MPVTKIGALNINDFICFINKYAAKDPYANCTVDASIDINDFVCFLNKFAARLPVTRLCLASVSV